MNKTTFTGEDLKNLVESIFNGNLRQHLASNGAIAYANENSEKIILIDEESGEQTEKDLAEYLNVHFYNWKERLVETSDPFHNKGQTYEKFDDWVESLNVSMNESYALVEKTDEEVVASQDIDSATVGGKITFLVQTNKIKNLDYYVTKVRNAYVGKPQTIQNAFGKLIKAYILVGTLIYDQEPTMTQLGETVVVSCNFAVSYLNDASTYSDTKIELSLDGTNYYEMPITKGTYQTIFATNPVPTNKRPDITGVISTSSSMTKTLTFYDYNETITNLIDEKFWSACAYKIDTTETTAREVNIPVYLKITKRGHIYYHKDVIEHIEKVITDNDFDVCSISLRTWGKVE